MNLTLLHIFLHFQCENKQNSIDRSETRGEEGGNDETYTGGGRKVVPSLNLSCSLSTPAHAHTYVAPSAIARHLWVELCQQVSR